MKLKLKTLEASITDKLAAAQPADRLHRRGGGPQGRRGLLTPAEEDARSDMSPLPDDVIHAIEHPSDPEDDAAGEGDDAVGAAGRDDNGDGMGEGGKEGEYEEGEAGAGPAALALGAGHRGQQHRVDPAAMNALGY